MKRKLGIIITLSLVGVLILATILLAVFSKNYKPEFDNAPYQMTITNANGSGSYNAGTAYPEGQKRKFWKIC